MIFVLIFFFGSGVCVLQTQAIIHDSYTTQNRIHYICPSFQFCSWGYGRANLANESFIQWNGRKQLIGSYGITFLTRNLQFSMREKIVNIDYSTSSRLLRNIESTYQLTSFLFFLYISRSMVWTKNVRNPFILLTHLWILIRHLCRSRKIRNDVGP